MIEYAILKLVWWVFIGVLLVGFAVLDGFDLGVGTLLPWVARRDIERRVLINTIGPLWEGNQVWFITAGGALFAAWPMVYATAFSGLYAALIMVLFALILRPVGFDFRSKVSDPRWRAVWDWGLFAGGAVPSLVFGIAFGNLLLGLPFHFDRDLHVVWQGGFTELLRPFALLAGVVSLAMMVLHGASWIALRTEGVLARRARCAAVVAGGVFVIAFAAAGVWASSGLTGLRMAALPDVNQVLMPTMKSVTAAPGAWLDTYRLYPWTWVIPGAALAGALLAMAMSALGRRAGFGFLGSAVAVGATVITAGVALFPFVMPSGTRPDHSLTLWDSVSSPLTLNLMFWAVVLLLPPVIAYTTWAYRVLRGTITESTVEQDPHSLY